MGTSVWMLHDLDNITSALMEAQERRGNSAFTAGYIAALHDVRTALGLQVMQRKLLIDAPVGYNTTRER